MSVNDMLSCDLAAVGYPLSHDSAIAIESYNFPQLLNLNLYNKTSFIGGMITYSI